jgi:hypothetical protein
MQEPSNTSTIEGAGGTIGEKNLGSIGPFNQSEIETVARKCVADLGLNWNNLSDRAKSQYIEVTRNTLAIKENDEHLAGLIGGTSRGMKEFQKSVLTEFRNSPKWDEDEFVSGWKIGDNVGGNELAGGVGGADNTTGG